MIHGKRPIYTCHILYPIICTVLALQSLLSLQPLCPNNSVLNFLSHIRACELFTLYIH